MKRIKPVFWNNRKNFYSFILLPFSWIVNIIVFFKKKLIKSIKFNIPVICVGNIYIGGTGKTPSSIFIANELLKIGKKPSIIRKYYEDHDDEYDLIRKYFNNLFISKKRSEAIIESEKNGYDCVILDDGFQDYKIKKNLNIICFNEKQQVGNGFVIPSGPLRESLNSLKDAKIVIINGEKNLNFEKEILKFNRNLEIFYSKYFPLNLNDFREKNLLALAGIGNPENFFKLLENEGLKIEKKMVYPDHYKFKYNEIFNIINYAKNNKLQIIVTEKDYYKIKKFNLSEIKFLSVKYEIENKERLIKMISSIYD